MDLPKDDRVKDLDNLMAIDHGVIAKPHTPVYKMHRYYARRPHTVFSELISHYSNPGSIILDPFCGGGVTIVESLRLGRKAIGVDLNPLATFITRMEVTPLDLDTLGNGFNSVYDKVREEIAVMYLTECPVCKKPTQAEWFKWSKVFECPTCKSSISIAETNKKSPGRYECSKCRGILKPSESKRIGVKLVEVYLDCELCNFKGIKNPDKEDLLKAEYFDKNFSSIVAKRSIQIPADEFPNGDRQKDDSLFKKGVRYFSDFFTKRNLIANGLLKHTISDYDSNELVRDFLIFTFSANLSWTSSLSDDAGHAWQRHAFWLPDIFYELNVIKSFRKRFIEGQSSIINGKKYSNKEIGSFAIEGREFKDLLGKSTFLLLTQSSDSLPLPSDSVDVVITDPPYGGNVQYAELSDFWTVWLKDLLNLKSGIINNEKEAITTRHSGFPTAKNLIHYREMLHEIFLECRRVLKPNRWMVMTFHNREFKVWNSIHLAAHDAGFTLSEEDGMIYQPPIQNYTQTMHTKAGGSMLGDFILSFNKALVKPQKQLIQAIEIDKRIQELAAEAVLHHHGATLSVIYMKLIPFLLNQNLLEKMDEKAVIPYLRPNFEEHDGKWHLKEKVEDNLDKYLAEYSKQHYKENYRVLDFVPVEARLEYLIRSYLYEKGSATQDEVLNEIYTNLINSNAAEYGEISRVLNRIARLAGENGRKVWKLKEDLARIEQLDFIEEKIKEVVKTSEESEHDLMIERLLKLGEKEGYTSHIGKTEQKKYTRFRQLSIPMADNVQYGIDKKGFDIITEIDVLWMKGDSIIAAFEVEKSTTIHSGIDRFRNLFAVQPNSKIGAFIVIPDSRENEAKDKINSPANRKEGLVDKIGYILFKDLKIENSNVIPDFEGIKMYVR